MLTIKSSLKNYEVLFVDQLSDIVKRLNELGNSIIVLDKNIATLYPDFKAALAEKSPIFELEATEENKTLAGAEEILTFLQQNKANKNTTLVAIGGGITQDVTSFVAHIYYRGLPFFFVPTTLLAMSDSCIGAKAGLNFHGFKNQIGMFHAPEVVLICDKFLKTLTDEAICSGYGEIFKLMLIGSESQYQDLVKTLDTEGFRNSKTREYIFESLKIKKTFIEEDEFDVGIRRILNYGHTFGHALELATDYAIPHGIAVARGMDLVNYIAYNDGTLAPESYHHIHAFVLRHFHCGFCPQVNTDTLVGYAKQDKKITSDRLNLILLQTPGKLKIEATPLDERLRSTIQAYLQSNDALYCIK